jgi:arabinofuranosyltransferase
VSKLIDIDSPKSFDRFDVLILTALFGLTVLYMFRYVNFGRPPFEDAAILMRYAQHLAEGYGIVWNVGESPVDGATDFLFMAFIAGLMKCGLTVEFAVRSISMISHFLTIFFVYLTLRKKFCAGKWSAVISSSFIAIGPGLHYTAAYFGTTFLALCAVISWYVTVKVIQEANPSNKTIFLFSMFNLLTGLIRPEGVFLAFFFLASVVYVKGFKHSKLILLHFVTVYSLCGGIYFFWHWKYFGYPLPNPFYIKGGGLLYPQSLKQSLINTFYLTVPFILFSLTILFHQVVNGISQWLRKKSDTAQISMNIFSKNATAHLLPLIGFTSIWVLLSNEMNYDMRFQYAIVPLVVTSWYPIVCEIKKWMGKQRVNHILSNSLFCGVLCCTLFYQHGTTVTNSYTEDGRFAIANILSDYRHKKYSIAISEAGLIPLYSGWRALDTWGLNDQWIAHHGRVTDAYLSSFDPDVIMFYAYFSPVVSMKGSGSFYEMTVMLKEYAEKNKYVLAASFGISPYETHYYYVKRGIEDSEQIAKKIRTANYAWAATGQRCINYAQFLE